MSRFCPDGGKCHHGCADNAECFRVRTCGPLSGTRPHDEWVLKIGKLTHLLTRDGRNAQCGVEAPDLGAHDARDVDCPNCRRTKRYKVYMGKDGY